MTMQNFTEQRLAFGIWRRFFRRFDIFVVANYFPDYIYFLVNKEGTVELTYSTNPKNMTCSTCSQGLPLMGGGGSTKLSGSGSKKKGPKPNELTKKGNDPKVQQQPSVKVKGTKSKKAVVGS